MVSAAKNAPPRCRHRRRRVGVSSATFGYPGGVHDDTTVTVTFAIRQQPGDGQDCQGNRPFPVEITLPEPLGARTLLDGNEDPPRKAGEPPAS